MPFETGVCFPQSCGSPIIKCCWPSRPDSQSLCRIPRLRSLTWGSEPSQQCENFFGITHLQSVGHPPGGCRTWFFSWLRPSYRFAAISLSALLFWWVPVPPVDGCSTPSGNFGALAGGDERKSFSTILNRKPLTTSFLTPCSRSSEFSRIPYPHELCLSSQDSVSFWGKGLLITVSVTNWFWLEGIKLDSDTAKDFFLIFFIPFFFSLPTMNMYYVDNW